MMRGPEQQEMALECLKLAIYGTLAPLPADVVTCAEAYFAFVSGAPTLTARDEIAADIVEKVDGIDCNSLVRDYAESRSASGCQTAPHAPTTSADRQAA